MPKNVQQAFDYTTGFMIKAKQVELVDVFVTQHSVIASKSILAGETGRAVCVIGAEGRVSGAPNDHG